MVVDTKRRDELDEERTDRLFNALADRTRRDILRRAMDGDLSMSALARAYPMSNAAVQKHLGVLERAGLVTKERSGREQLVHTEIDTIRAAHRLLDQFEAIWRDRMDRFAEVLDQTEKGETP